MKWPWSEMKITTFSTVSKSPVKLTLPSRVIFPWPYLMNSFLSKDRDKNHYSFIGILVGTMLLMGFLGARKLVSSPLKEKGL
jgi:hypothetical protein